jgi:small-conductance mechanosensitive channel
MSQKGHYKRFSKDGFQPLTHQTSGEMANPNDITIDIPMTKVATNSSATGARRADIVSPARSQPSTDFPDQMDEKHPHRHFHRGPGGPGGRRRRAEDTEQRKKNKEEGTLNAVGRFYKKVYNFSVITRYFTYVAPLALCIAIPIIVGATSSPDAKIGGVRIVWFFAWVEVVWVSLWISKIVAHFLPRLFQFLIGVVSSGTRKYSLILSALEIPLSLVGWAVTSLATFVPFMTLNPDSLNSNPDKNLQPWQRIVKNILFACVFSTLVLLVEKLFIQLLSISYHRKQFDDRIKESKRNIHLVTLLYDASRQMFPAYCREFAEEDYLINDVLDLAGVTSSRNSLMPGHKRSGSATPMRLIQNVARVGDKVTAVFGNVAQEITGKKVFNPTASHSIVVQALEKKRSAEALARRLWMSFVLEGKDALSIEDIMDVLGSDREAEAQEAFDVLDVDSNGDISLEEMALRITEFGRDRQSIANSMHDVDQAINVLDNLLCTVVFIVVIFIFVAWLNSNFTTTLATAGTALLSMSFVFAGTAQEVLGSCIFLFVKHPFDVGDRVDVSDVAYVVERMSLLYTVFRRVKDQKKSQVPNIVLNSNWIDNVSRSKAMREQVQLYVNFDTSFEDLDLLKTEMIKFVRDKENARDFQPDIDIEVTGVAEMNKMELRLEIRHKSNWSNEAVRAARRSKFMCALVTAMRKVPLYGPGAGGPAAGDKANPTYSVAISNEEAKKNKDDFDVDKDKKRLVPLLDQDASGTPTQAQPAPTDYLGSASGAEVREAAAIDHLIKRNVAVDPEESFDRDRDVESHRRRAEEVDEVRNILRRESTTGRRRAARQSGLYMNDSLGSRTIPTIAEPSPPEPVSVPAATNPRVSYFEDTNNHPTTSGAAASQAWTNVAPLNYNPPQPLSNRPSSPATSQATTVSSPSRYVPGNAFSQAAHADQQVPRMPVPGMPELKRTLQQPPTPPK